MKKKDLVKTLLKILEDWGNGEGTDLDGSNYEYYTAIVELLKEEEE